MKNAAFGYGGKPVLSGVDLEIGEGDFVGVIGENGAGKTTLLKGVMGLLEPVGGEVSHDASVRSHIGYVPQRGQLDSIYPLTAFDVARMGYMGAGSASAIVGACLEKVQMARRANDPYASLSGGQQQRVLIARALAVAPRLLVLDEPTSGVDAAAEQGIMQMLVELNRDEKIAVLLVSHKTDLLKRYAKRMVTL